jgi:membrane associated rhomboid family serine protease
LPSKTAVVPATNLFNNTGAFAPVPTTPRFQTCPVCWEPTPVCEPRCVNCGQRSLRANASSAQEQYTHRVLSAFFARATPVTYAIFLLNVWLYLLMTVSAEGRWLDNLLHGVNGTMLLAFGAETNATLRLGEWFRLVTPIFLHLSGLHLLSNSFALAIVGPQVERLYGSARFLLIYLTAGCGGMAASAIKHTLTGQPAVVAVGASGAIFGLFGVLAVFSFKYRKELPKNFINAFAIAVLPAIGINLFVGFTIPFIDNSTHVGGLLAGVLLAFIIPYLVPGRARFPLAHVGLMLACVLLVVYCFLRAYNARPSVGPAQQAAESVSLSSAPESER